MPTASIHDVARRSGVSTATVSRALRDLPNVSLETRRRVQEVAAELGYVASRSAAALSSGQSRSVAVVVPSLGHWFFTSVIAGVDAELRGQGYDAILVDLGAQEGTAPQPFEAALVRKRADALIVLGFDPSAHERRELRHLAVPTVVVGASAAGVRSVGVDDARAARSAVEHLLSLGHTRIAHIGGENEWGLQTSVATLRRRAWHSALAERGIVAAPHWFASAGFQLPRAKAAALALLSRPDRPTAIFAGSDEMAFGTLLAARELAIRVPDDLSVVGIDDHVWSGAFDLTTVRQDPRAQGALAARTVLDDLRAGAADSGSLRVPSTLVIRGSTAAPPGADGTEGALAERAGSPA